jgi:hypothetical protein
MQFVKLKVKKSDILKLLSRVSIVFILIIQILMQVILS